MANGGHVILQVTIEDFEKHFDDDAVIAFFESLEVGAMDAWTLFMSHLAAFARNGVLRTDTHTHVDGLSCSINPRTMHRRLVKHGTDFWVCFEVQ